MTPKTRLREPLYKGLIINVGFWRFSAFLHIFALFRLLCGVEKGENDREAERTLFNI